MSVMVQSCINYIFLSSKNELRHDDINHVRVANLLSTRVVNRTGSVSESVKRLCGNYPLYFTEKGE